MDRTYIGSYTQFHKPDSSSVWYGGDCERFYQEYLEQLRLHPSADGEMISSQWSYNFNSLGYRGDLFQANAGYTLAVVGCSIAVGEGVPWEHTFGYYLKELIKKERQPDAVQYLNFSQSGASNDYIVRTAIRQMQSVLPDLLVVYFTHVARKEIVEGNSFYSFGSWCADESELFRSVLGSYTHQEAVINTLKNIYLLQEYCRSRGVRYIFTLQEYDKLNIPEIVAHEALKDYWSLIDWEKVTPFRMQWKDRARDNRHPGPRSHREFAEKIYARINRERSAVSGGAASQR